MKQFARYLAYGLFAGVIWGLTMYFVYTWLVRYSVLLAYFTNLCLIVMALASDEYTFRLLFRSLQSEEALRTLAKSRFFQLILEAFVSFKAMLYLFYILLLLLSQVVAHYPALVPASVGAFVDANEYSILILMAIDLFSGQLRRDVKRRNLLAEQFNQRLDELRNAA